MNVKSLKGRPGDMKKSIAITLLSIFIAESVIAKESSAEVSPPKPSRQIAGYAYQTVSTSTILAAEIVGYCKSIGVAGYQEVDTLWTERNLKWIKAADRMMSDLAPDEKVKALTTGKMDQISKHKAQKVIETSIKSSKDPKKECGSLFGKIKSGFIDVERHEVAKEALSQYIK